MQVGNNISDILKQKDWSQKRLALEIGTDEAYISKLVSGKNKPSMTTAFKVARALGHIIEDVFTFKEVGK